MASFTLAGTTAEYLRLDPGPTGTSSWEYGKYPTIMATLPWPKGTSKISAGATGSRDSFPHKQSPN